MDTPDRMEVDEISQDPPELPPQLPYGEKWNVLKPYLKYLYLHLELKQSEIASQIKARYNFPAGEQEYKNRFRGWGWKRNVSASKKDVVLKAVQTRVALGKRSRVVDQGKDLAPRKLQRHVKETIKRDSALITEAISNFAGVKMPSGQPFVLGDNFFLNWTTPYDALCFLGAKLKNGSVPSPRSPAVMAGVEVITPPSDSVWSPSEMQSPIARQFNQKRAIERARMLVMGQHKALNQSMSQSEKEAMALWLFEFNYWATKTAKHWGRGPREWNMQNLWLNIQVPSPVVRSPSSIQNPRQDSEAHDISLPTPLQALVTGHSVAPPKLCRWIIHCHPDAYDYVYEIITEPVHEEEDPDPNIDPTDESSWSNWPATALQGPSLETKLLKGLQESCFTRTDEVDLPIAIPQVMSMTNEANISLLEKALGFAIKGRNADLVSDLLYRIKEPLTSIQPLHLATSYLDGSRSCCLIVLELVKRRGWREKGRLPTNDLGHSVVDNLMITILRSHTRLSPGDVEPAWKEQQLFPGEEVDICGRWDAESECFLQRTSRGNRPVAFEWKHKFCHTSIQTISHCLSALAYSGDYTVFHESSGLFVKRCFTCGRKLELLPLHVAVIVAFSLAQYGQPEEDLFGIITITLQFLSHGSKPRETANISPELLLGIDSAPSPSNCEHREYTPLELAQAIPRNIISMWTRAHQDGWNVMCEILGIAEIGPSPDYIDEDGVSDTVRLPEQAELDVGPFYSDMYIEKESNDEDKRWLGRTHKLAVLFGVCQTEYLTYRRLREGDSWQSNRFDMTVLLQSLVQGGKLAVGGILEQMLMHKVEYEGHFSEAATLRFPRADEVATEDISNLEKDWSLLKIVPPPIPYE